MKVQQMWITNGRGREGTSTLIRGPVYQGTTDHRESHQLKPPDLEGG
jgi:hypothetical protein